MTTIDVYLNASTTHANDGWVVVSVITGTTIIATTAIEYDKIEIAKSFIRIGDWAIYDDGIYSYGVDYDDGTIVSDYPIGYKNV